MKNDFVYWDDMWNEEPLETSCCGKWDKDGKCTCDDIGVD